MLGKIKFMSFIILIIALKTIYAQTERSVNLVPLQSADTYYDYQDSWAVLIGINNFKYWNGLNYAVRDAEAMKDILTQEFGFKNNHIILLTDQLATLKNIKRVLGDIFKEKAKQNDRVLVFWAGHGHTDSLLTGGEMGYLVPFDGNKDYYSTCFSMQEIKTLANIIPAKHILFLIDACYSGFTTDQTRDIDRDFNISSFLETYLRSSARQIITAGKKGEKVYENSLWGHSAFTFELIKGLKGRRADYDNDGVITATDLAAYLKKNVPIASEGRQNPQYRIFGGEGEFVFVFKNRIAPPLDIEAPNIENRTKKEAKKKEPFLIQALITDAKSGVKNVQFEFRNSNDDKGKKVNMNRKSGSRFEYEISKEYINPPQIVYSISAIDEYGNQKTIKGKVKIDNGGGLRKWVIRTAVAGIGGYLIYYIFFRPEPTGILDITVDVN